MLLANLSVLLTAAFLAVPFGFGSALPARLNVQSEYETQPFKTAESTVSLVSSNAVTIHVNIGSTVSSGLKGLSEPEFQIAARGPTQIINDLAELSDLTGKIQEAIVAVSANPPTRNPTQGAHDILGGFGFLQKKAKEISDALTLNSPKGNKAEAGQVLTSYRTFALGLNAVFVNLLNVETQRRISPDAWTGVEQAKGKIAELRLILTNYQLPLINLHDAADDLIKTQVTNTQRDLMTSFGSMANVVQAPPVASSAEAQAVYLNIGLKA